MLFLSRQRARKQRARVCWQQSPPKTACNRAMASVAKIASSENALRPLVEAMAALPPPLLQGGVRRESLGDALTQLANKLVAVTRTATG